MSKVEEEMRPDYGDADLGKGVRGKYYERYERGTNLALLEQEVAEAFPTSRAVNEALKGLIRLSKKAGHSGTQQGRTSRKRISTKK